MAENIASEINKSYSTLIALKNNLPKSKDIEEKYAQLYNGEIERLTKLGFNDLEEFKVPESETEHLLTSFNTITGAKHYSREKYVDREILLIKIDSILGFFSINSSKEEIGFKV
jgi:hypothetical protein